MSAINDLIAKITDADLRDRIAGELRRITKEKKFGLVFEEHRPECTPLRGVPIAKGTRVAQNDDITIHYIVRSINGATARCAGEDGTETDLPLADLVPVATFGEPIYPCLIPVDTVENDPGGEPCDGGGLWHTLIEADNYHALQLLEYLCAGKVDCIYIDPPYNTGARDWKYNNDYVDSADAYRHSKWLSFMQKRLKLAKKLLNPADSVLIVTIDEKEYLHLGCLLEELFPEARMQMVSIVTNPFGQERAKELARVDEYAFFLFFGEAEPNAQEDDLLTNRNQMGEVAHTVTTPNEKIRWEWLLRGGADALRKNNPQLFFPVFINPELHSIHSVGEPLPMNQDRNTVTAPEGMVTVWPIKTNGIEGRWRCSPDYLRELIEKGYARVGEHDLRNDRWSLLYLNKATIRRIEKGEIKVKGRGTDGALILEKERAKKQLFSVKTVWNRPNHRAGEWGTRYLRVILPGRSFPYPKSLYAVHDCLRVITANKPDALIVDFFAGSGTTLHAVNLLNAEDGGHRRCIMVTNNEVSAEEEKSLAAAGHCPGDEEWERLGIARYVTWPRTVYSITGHRADGTALDGAYFTTLTRETAKQRTVRQIAFPIAPTDKATILTMLKIPQNALSENGAFAISDKAAASVLFNADAAGEWLENLDGTDAAELYVATPDKKRFAAIKKLIAENLGPVTSQENVTLPMSDGFKANAAYFRLGFLDKNSVALGRQLAALLPLLWMKAGCRGACPAAPEQFGDMLILPPNRFALLIEESAFADFRAAITPDIETVYIITNSASGYKEMASAFPGRAVFRLYKDYLDNFRLNVRR